MAKNVKIVHPAFTQTQRRNAIAASTSAKYLTGRWVAVDGDGKFAVVGTSRDAADAYGLYWLLEGTHEHIGDNTEFDDTTKMSTNFVELPSNKNTKALTGAYGVFVGYTGPEGVKVDDTIANGARLGVDQYGRLYAVTSTEVTVAVAEVITTDGNGITSLTFRTTGL